MTILTSLDGQTGLPRYFASVFSQTSQMRRGRLDITLPDGRVFRIEGAEPGSVAAVTVHNPDVFARLVREGDNGFSDAYLEGWWSTPDLMAFMDLMHDGNDEVLDGFPAVRLIRAYERFRFWLQSNSRRQAPRNISHHYDLGNDFYRIWLDETMTYSSALFTSGQESLEAAQTAKFAAIVDRLDVSPGDHLLEIGCGWGGFAEYAAGQRGLRVTGITLSREQHDFAVERMAAAGLSEMVGIRLCDYRDMEGQFDAVVSIEMFEAVGERYWAAYFDTVRDRLKPGGHAQLQIITVPDHRFEVYRQQVDFIQKYIFPGGMLPSPSALRAEIARGGLALTGSFEFRESYSQTLRRWYETFNERWDEVAKLGFDDRFRRMWNYYLASCAAAFRTGICDVTQVTLRAPA